MLDAGLLAGVPAPTRGQTRSSSTGDALAADLALRAVDFSALSLVVVSADDGDLALHASLLAEIDKASGGKAIWRAALAPLQSLAMAQ